MSGRLGPAACRVASFIVRDAKNDTSMCSFGSVHIHVDSLTIKDDTLQAASWAHIKIEAKGVLLMMRVAHENVEYTQLLDELHAKYAIACLLLRLPVFHDDL